MRRTAARWARGSSAGRSGPRSTRARWRRTRRSSACSGTCPNRLWPGTARLFREWHLHFPPIPGVNALARELKGRGYRVYLLSNAGTRFTAYREAIPCRDCFDGEVVSAFVRQVKPDPAIYETLLTRYGLSAAECFFIDDMPANIAAAKDAGMAGFVYGGDVDALRRALREAGVEI